MANAPSNSGEAVIGARWQDRLLLNSAFLVTDLPLGVVTFTVVTVGLSLTLGLAATVLLALPILASTLRASDALAQFERQRVAALLGIDIVPPAKQPFRPHPEQNPQNPAGSRLGNMFSHFRHRLLRRSTWRAAAYNFLLLPIGTVTFSVVVILWTIPIALFSVPVVVFFAPGRANFSQRLAIGFGLLGAFVVLSLLPRLLDGLVDLRVAFARTLLGRDRNVELVERVTTLESSRSALVDAVDAERRRIERDLHDGAQQRLVALAMDLGLAKAKLERETAVPSDVRALLDEAHAEAKRAIAELRDVARGVHPAILEDRGLDAALSSLAARCPVPVRIDVDMATRPNRATEAVAYYVVAEALTNVAKHAGASKVAVRVQQSSGGLGIEVTDDGCGGAAIGPPGGLGGGLAGLRDRLNAVDGTLTILSPAGGPTTLLAEMQCAS